MTDETATLQSQTAAPTWGADPYAAALHSGDRPLYLRREDGWLLRLEVERWCAAPDAADRSALRRCRGTVLDVGCGPGRITAALAAQGRTALGVDPNPAAVERARRLGGAAMLGSIFDPVPEEGGWDTVLLLDGNVGIGGDPRRLLARLARLVAPEGRLLVEVDAVELDERVRVRLDDGRGGAGEAFPWARLGRRALRRHARAAGWRVAEEWSDADREFAELTLRRRSRGRRR